METDVTIAKPDASTALLPSASSASSFSAWLAAAWLACLSVLIFWRLPGVTQFDTDDYLQTKLIPLFSIPHTLSEYLTLMQSRRALLCFYKGFFELNGGNLDQTVLILVGTYVASAFLLFFLLKRVFSTRAAALGAALYLAQGVKFHSVIAYNAQAYTLVILGFMAILWILTSRLPRLVQCVSVTVIHWITLHFYEILIVTLPIYPIFWLGPALVKKRLPSWRDVLFSAAPAAVTAIHVYLLSLSPTPIWGRNIPADPNYFHKVPFHLVDLLDSGMTQLVGKDHWSTVQQSLGSFVKVDLRADHSLWIPFCISAAAAVAVIFACVRDDSQRAGQKGCAPFTRWAFLASGALIMLATPLIAFPLSLSYVPSRIFSLASLGLAMTIAALLDLLPKRLCKALAVLTIIWVMIEAAMFSDFTRQSISASKVDVEVTKSLLALKDVQLVRGAQVYISLPFNGKIIEYWRIEPPEYYHSRCPARLWAAYDLGLNNIVYSSVMRFPGTNNAWGLRTWADASLKNAPANKLYPFYLDDDGHMHPIGRIELQDGTGRTQRIISTALDGTTSSSILIKATPEKQFAKLFLAWFFNLNCPSLPSNEP
jgi:hypothetical protein